MVDGAPTIGRMTDPVHRIVGFHHGAARLAGWCAAALLAGPAAAQTADLPPLRPLSMVSAEAALARLPGTPTPAPRTSGTLDLRGRQVHIAEYLLLFDLAGEQPGPVRDSKLLGMPVPEGKALEIWTLWDRAVGPRSVGLIDRARTTPLRLDQLPLGRDQLFEITIEPATGSPTGRPTGPIVAKGTTSQAL